MNANAVYQNKTYTMFRFKLTRNKFVNSKINIKQINGIDVEQFRKISYGNGAESESEIYREQYRICVAIIRSCYLL